MRTCWEQQMAAALTKGHEDKHTGMQGCPGIGIAYTTHKKWSEWKSNRSAVIAGRFWRKHFFIFFSILKSLGFRAPPALPLSSKSSCDHSAPVSFPFWPFFMCGVCYPNPRAPLWYLVYYYYYECIYIYCCTEYPQSRDILTGRGCW